MTEPKQPNPPANLTPTPALSGNGFPASGALAPGKPGPDTELLEAAEEFSEFSGKKKGMLLAMLKHLGIVTKACKEIGISRAIYYVWRNEDPAFCAAADSVAEFVIDFAEKSLFKQIQEGNTAATIFFLKTRAKERGYVERTELTGKDGTPVAPANITVNVLNTGVPFASNEEDVIP